MQQSKIVNVYPIKNITGVNPPITSPKLKITLSFSEIRICLLSGAGVYEYVPSTNKYIRLSLSTYNIINLASLPGAKYENPPSIGGDVVSDERVDTIENTVVDMSDRLDQIENSLQWKSIQ